MAAKLLHSLADENPDLRKQIGCMTGIFQIFDRHHVLTGKRLPHKRLPSGNPNFSDNNLERQCNSLHFQQTSEINFNKGASEKQRLSTESSGASCSSACSSSASSVDCDKTAQHDFSSLDQIIFPETSSREPVMNQSTTSLQLARHSLDLRDVVKDSMYREARGLSVKTATRDEAAGHEVKHRDSPRPLQLSKRVDGSNGVGISGKQNTSVDLKESLRDLAKLREAPWCYDDARENLRPSSSYDSKDGSWHSISKDAPRFSYDGREINCLSFESWDAFKSTVKLKELPRLSLDSRESLIRGSNFDSKPSHVSRISKSSGIMNEKDPSLPQSLVSQKRPPSVIAKLMGLDALPDSPQASDDQFASIKTFPVHDGDSSTKLLKANSNNRPIRISNSPRNSLKEPTSPHRRNPDLVMKPILSSRFPIEPAPWKMQDGNRGPQRTSSRSVKVPLKSPNSFPSVYSEIEKRLKDLEFKQTGKDLRALKQILEAMQTKGLLETSKQEQASSFAVQEEHELQRYVGPNLNPKSTNQRNQHSSHVNASTLRGSGSSRTFESPIVIMKPAKLVEKSSISSPSAISADGFSDIHGPQHVGTVEDRKSSNKSRTAKDQSPKYSQRDAGVGFVEKRAGSSRNPKPTHSSSRSQQQTLENTATSSIKSSGSVSPRLQQKKLEMEKRSRPPTPPSNSNKPRRQTNRQPADSGSPGGRARMKHPNSQQCDDQASEVSNESKTLSCQGDDASVQSEGNVALDSKSDVEVTSSLRSTKLKSAEYLASNSIQKKATHRLDEEESFAELATVAPEYPSPVSVLDNSAYKDDAPSPVKQIPNALTGDDPQDFNEIAGEDLWRPSENLSNSKGSGLTSEINRKKLENIENLVQKLRRLNSSHDEARTDYIALLCENTNPDHRYISEILLASGLLLRDLGSGLTTFQLHPSGHPINPELFFVLEQTKTSSLQPKDECSPEKAANLKSDREKHHRKLIFDAVNEILVGKLALVSVSPKPWLKPERLTKKTPNAQKLLKELCYEIEQFQTKKLECSFEAEDDSLKSILWEDVMHRSGSWKDFSSEISGVVLDVERSIFKDLVDEIVRGEAVNLRVKPRRRRQRQLFAK